jgi:hypothetical protein
VNILFIQLLLLPGMQQVAFPLAYFFLQESTNLYLLSAAELSKMENVMLVSFIPGMEALNAGCLSSYSASTRKYSSEM